jgi:hypothetical protein
MEELWELRRYVEAGDVDAALALLQGAMQLIDQTQESMRRQG